MTPYIPYTTNYKHKKIVKHKKDINTSYSKSKYAKLYNTSKWRQNRNRYIRHYPVCSSCKINNIIREANVVDHIIPVSEGGSFYDWNNLQSMCTSCHAKKTANEVNKRRSNMSSI